MSEQQVVLEHDSDRPLLGRDEHVQVGVVEHRVIDRDPAAIYLEQAGECSQQRGFPGAIRAEDREHFASFDGEIDVERQRAESQHKLGVEAHAAPPVPPSQRSRSPTSTANETAISTRLRISASCGLVSRAR